MYKHPTDTLATIFCPTVILGLVNLFIFFQAVDIGGRIQSISTILVSFVGMVTILGTILRNNQISIASILVYLMILTSMLCLYQTIYLYFRK